MAEETKNVEVPKVTSEESSTPEVTDRGMFDFLGKKKEETKPEEIPIESEFEHKAQISEPAPEIKHEVVVEEEEKKPSLLEKLHRNDSSSSSSSEEEGEDGEKRKKKKKEKKKTDVEGEVKAEEEKKGFMEKLKGKLPGHKKPEDGSAAAPTPVVHAPPADVEAYPPAPAEKKGILEKIKEKLPGYHPKTVEEETKKKESD